MNVKPINLVPSELKAIEEHKYFMSIEQNREVSIEEAIEDFISNYRADWLDQKMKKDSEEQRCEIEKHKWLRSEERGEDIGSRAASEEWIDKYASIWRKEKESLQANGFDQLKITVDRNEGLHIIAPSHLADIARNSDCDMYFHQKGMEYYNFILDGNEYLNVKSILAFQNLHLGKGDSIEFLVTGRQAKEALAAVRRFIRKQCVGY
jgi:phosphotransferase system HPr-like phosphotransfer protein